MLIKYKQNLKKSVSPLIATILLVVVAVVLVTILLNFGKDFTLTSLEKVKGSELIENKNLGGFITVQSAVEGYDKATILLNNNHKEKNITIVAYKIISKNSDFDINDKIMYFKENIDFNANSTSVFPIYYFPSNNFDLYLISDDNSFIKVNVNPSKRNYDNYNLKNGLVLDLPLFDIYLKEGLNLFDPSPYLELPKLNNITPIIVGTATSLSIEDGYFKISQTSLDKAYIVALWQNSIDPNKYYKLNFKIFVPSNARYSNYYIKNQPGDVLKDITNEVVLDSWTDISYNINQENGFYIQGIGSPNIDDYFLLKDLSIKEYNGSVIDRSSSNCLDSINNTTLEYEGLFAKTDNSIAYLKNKNAFGLITDFKFEYTGNNFEYVDIIALDNVPKNNSYTLLYGVGGGVSNRIYLRYYQNGNATYIQQTSENYILPNIKYRMIVFRNSYEDEFVEGDANTFGFFIQGRKNYPITNKIYSNPNLEEMELVFKVKHDSYIISNYFNFDIDEGDSISDLIINKIKQKSSDYNIKEGSFNILKPSLNFDGVNDYIDLGMNKPTDLTGDITLSVWINPSLLSINQNLRIIDNGNFKLLTNLSSNKTLLFASDGFNFKYFGENVISLNTWYHILITRPSNGANTNFYINGILSGNANQNTGLPIAGNTNTYIGNRATLDRAFNGYISNLKIWNRILSENEINLIYNKESEMYTN